MNASAEKRLQELIETRTVVVIAGPTASGKTAVSLELAHYINAEIISADSRQIFKYLDIGTAKATAEERSSAPHHFIDIVEPDEYYSAGIFGKQALDTVNEIFSRNALPLIVGGSGLYIKALCEGFFEEEQKTPPEIKSELEQRFKNEGIEPLYEELKQFDQLSAELYRDKNPRRILRALEFYLTTGRRLSQAHLEQQTKPEFNVVYFGIEHERKALYDRINRRCEAMWSGGLLDETQAVMDKGFSPTLNSLNTVGYKEAIAYIDGRITENEALELFKRNTRRYAKRQMTWFRANRSLVWLSGSAQKIADDIRFILNL